MATITQAIKSILNGTKTPTATTSDLKSALGTLYDFVTDLLGTDSANKAAARAALGAIERAGMRNLLINADFRINQRAYISGQITTSTNQYCLDRWRVSTLGQAATFVTDANGRMVTAPAGGIEQIIEGGLIDGGTYAIDWEGTASCTVGGTARTKGATFTLTANTNVAVKFSGGTVTRARLCPNSAAAWETRPLELETALCLRYYERNTASYCYMGVTSGQHTIFFTVPKRITPSVSINNQLLTTSYVSADVDHFVVSSGSTNPHAFFWTADAELTAV